VETVLGWLPVGTVDINAITKAKEKHIPQLHVFLKVTINSINLYNDHCSDTHSRGTNLDLPAVKILVEHTVTVPIIT